MQDINGVIDNSLVKELPHDIIIPETIEGQL